MTCGTILESDVPQNCYGNIKFGGIAGL